MCHTSTILLQLHVVQFLELPKVFVFTAVSGQVSGFYNYQTLLVLFIFIYKGLGLLWFLRSSYSHHLCLMYSSCSRYAYHLSLVYNLFIQFLQTA